MTLIEDAAQRAREAIAQLERERDSANEAAEVSIRELTAELEIHRAEAARLRLENQQLRARADELLRNVSRSTRLPSGWLEVYSHDVSALREALEKTGGST